MTRVTASHDCGWTGGHYDTQARAAFALRQHSCVKARRDASATGRGRARDAAVDRTPKPCHHLIADHQHGTYAAYKLDRCRCLPCAAACSAYNADRDRKVAYGRWAPYVDARPAADHLRALSAAGMGYKLAAAAAGLGASLVYPLLWGRPDRNGGQPRTKARRATVEAILAVPMPTVDDLGATVLVDGTGTRRRLEALGALGWAVQRLADHGGLNRQALDSALHAVPVRAQTARAVRDLYEQLWNTHPDAVSAGQKRGVTLALRRAAEHQWLPPLAWDEGDMDDPYSGPADEYAQPPGARPGVDLDEWLYLIHGGEDAVRAARRCGVTLGTVEMAARRADRQDVLSAIGESKRWAA